MTDSNKFFQAYRFAYSGLMKSAMFFGRGYGFSAILISIYLQQYDADKGHTVVMTVIVGVWVVGRADIVHLVRRAALHAARHGLLAAQSDPDDVVRVSRAASAANVLLLASGVDDDGVLEGSCKSHQHHATFIQQPNQPNFHSC